MTASNPGHHLLALGYLYPLQAEYLKAVQPTPEGRIIAPLIGHNLESSSIHFILYYWSSNLILVQICSVFPDVNASSCSSSLNERNHNYERAFSKARAQAFTVICLKMLLLFFQLLLPTPRTPNPVVDERVRNWIRRPDLQGHHHRLALLLQPARMGNVHRMQVTIDS